MAKILVYNDDTNSMETYYRDENEPMPYNKNNTLLVGEFRGSSKSPTLWTRKHTMEAWNTQREVWGSPINVGYAFKRPYEGGHSNQSQHYAGTAFDVAQGWSNDQRAKLRTSAANTGLWNYIEPVSISPTWVHFDNRQLPPACSGGGYPTLRQGNRGVYVLILQDGLNTLGYNTNGLDGVFGRGTENAIKKFQSGRGLTADGVVGCQTWRTLQQEVIGNGRTSSTVD